MKSFFLPLLIASPLAFPLADALGSSETATTTVVDDEEDPLHIAMGDMEEALGKLRRAIRKEETLPDALVAITALQKATLAAKVEVPDLAAKQPEAARADFARGYRLMMVECLEAQLACEKAILKGDLEGAKVLYKKIQTFEDDGHETYSE